MSGDIAYKDDDADDSFSYLTRMIGALFVADAVPPSALRLHHPPLPTSAHYLEELLSYKLSRAKRNSFCYIRCLDPVDREIFQAKMIELILKNSRHARLYEDPHLAQNHETNKNSGYLQAVAYCVLG